MVAILVPLTTTPTEDILIENQIRQELVRKLPSAYRISASWWMFAAAGIGVILIAPMTVSFQSVKAALANPVRSLRSE